MAETKEIMEALSWFTADRFKSLQRKLTTARNTIQQEALSRQMKAFLTTDEIETLTRAAGILGSVKSKVEHAKEIKAREEKARDRRLEDCKRQRQAMLSNTLPKPENDEDARDALLWALALNLHHQEINRFAYYCELKYFATDIDRIADKKRHHTVLGQAVGWHREVSEFLGEHLWPYDEEPDPARLEEIVRLVQGEWGDSVRAHGPTKNLLDRLDTELAIQQSDSVHRM